MLSLQSFPIKKKILKKEEKIILKNWKALWSEIHLIFFLTFNTVNELILVHSISKDSTYSIYEELFLFVTMIVHLHSQHNMICTCFKYPCGKLCRMLIDEYLSPSNMYLVTSPHHNHSVRSTPENRLMALELVTGQTSNQLSSFNRNIIQICLYLEGIGTFAKVRLFCMILKNISEFWNVLKPKRLHTHVPFMESIVLILGFRSVSYVSMNSVNVLLVKLICIFLVDRKIHMH